MESIDSAFFQSFIEKIPAGIAIMDKQYRYIIINKAVEEFHNMSADQIIGKTIYDVIPELAATVKHYIDEVLEHQSDHLNLRISGKTIATEEERHWKADYKYFVANDGFQGVIVSAEEITEQVKQEQRIENSKEYLRNVLDSLFAFVGVLTPDGTLTDANKAPLEAAGIKFEDVVNKKFWDCHWWCNNEQNKEKLKDAISRVAQGETIRYDATIQIAHNQSLPIDFMLAPLLDKNGNVVNLIPSGIDISERKAAEKQLIEKNRQLSHLLQEKTTLLNEVHHRVKNNLQVISSLLNLQGQFVDGHTAEQFRMCQQRVRAMALVHQLLYESDNLASVDLKAYIHKLVGLLTEGHVSDTQALDVRYHFPDAKLNLDLRKMIPLAFIITELITNSLKHGVIKGAGKHIDIMLEQQDLSLKLGIGDDGPGFDEAHFFASESLGNRLVKVFAKQLGAKISIPTIKPTMVFLLVPKVLEV